MVARLHVVLFFLTCAVACQQRDPPAHLTAFEDNAKWGYRGDHGVVVIPPRFEIAQDFSNGIAAVVDGEGWAYINTHGEVLLRPLVVDNGPDFFSEGLARFRLQRKIGFFDSAGRIVIAAKYDFAWPFSEGLAGFCEECKEIRENDEHSAPRGGKWGFIDRNGHPVIPARFDGVESFRNGRARVELERKWGYIDKKGQVVMD